MYTVATLVTETSSNFLNTIRTIAFLSTVKCMWLCHIAILYTDEML